MFCPWSLCLKFLQSIYLIIHLIQFINHCLRYSPFIYCSFIFLNLSLLSKSLNFNWMVLILFNCLPLTFRLFLIKLLNHLFLKFPKFKLHDFSGLNHFYLMVILIDLVWSSSCLSIYLTFLVYIFIYFVKFIVIKIIDPLIKKMNHQNQFYSDSSKVSA